VWHYRVPDSLQVLLLLQLLPLQLLHRAEFAALFVLNKGHNTHTHTEAYL
jgi:hypothetical protein